MSELAKKWDDALMAQILHDYKQYKKQYTHSDILSELNKLKQHKYAEFDYVYIQIINNLLFFPNLNTRNDCNFATDDRLGHYISIIHGAINYGKKHKLPPINGFFIFRISDGYNHIFDMPVINWSKPKNKPGFLFPDWVVGALKQKKRDYKTYAVDKSKKTNTIYFRGRETTRKTNKLRAKMGTFTTPFNINIKFDYEPYYNTSKYKYLLDLPGRKPWSIRLFELFLSNSLVIRIRLHKRNEQPWIIFYDEMFTKDQDYIELSYEVDHDKPVDDVMVENMRNNIIDVYNKFEKNEGAYDKIVASSSDKANALTKKHLYYYVYHMLAYYSKLVLFD